MGSFSKKTPPNIEYCMFSNSWSSNVSASHGAVKLVGAHGLRKNHFERGNPLWIDLVLHLSSVLFFSFYSVCECSFDPVSIQPPSLHPLTIPLLSFSERLEEYLQLGERIGLSVPLNRALTFYFGVLITGQMMMPIELGQRGIHLNSADVVEIFKVEYCCPRKPSGVINVTWAWKTEFEECKHDDSGTNSRSPLSGFRQWRESNFHFLVNNKYGFKGYKVNWHICLNTNRQWN